MINKAFLINLHKFKTSCRNSFFKQTEIKISRYVQHWKLTQLNNIYNLYSPPNAQKICFLICDSQLIV